MTTHEFLTLLLITLLIVELPAFGIYGMFRKAGAEGWKAFIPFYNIWTIMVIAKRPKYWFFLQFIPIAGWFITLGIYIEFVKTFGKFKFYEHTLASLLPLFYFTYLGFNKDDRFLGPEQVKRHKKTPLREWIDAGVFAVVAAMLIRTFIFEAYTIPTGSMEKTLLINDFLFVSKFSYGPRIPNTPLAVPFFHHTLPVFDTKSYVEWIRIPYVRWFPSPIKRNDVVVFNFPAGDTVINKDEYQSLRPYYDVARNLGNGNIDLGRKLIMDDPDDYPLIIRPVDKQENYIKRCVGLPGDSIRFRDDIVYINSVRMDPPADAQLHYIAITNGQNLDPDVMRDQYNLDNDKGDYSLIGNPAENKFSMLLTFDAKDKMIKAGLIKKIDLDYSYNYGGGDVMPYDSLHKWNRDNFGPVWIPYKGATITLTKENYAMYERAIRTYEHNKLEMRGDQIYVNDQPANHYTFQMNYYWMTGDNRQDSQDSRYWGFVPEDHVVGQASLIWMSWDKGIRWRRLFNRIK
jgi:signal peptidase I